MDTKDIFTKALVAVLALSGTNITLTSEVTASQQVQKNYLGGINKKNVAKATVDGESVIEFLLNQAPHREYINEGIYTLPATVQATPSSTPLKNKTIRGYPLLETHKRSLRLDLKPANGGKDAILELQTGNGSISTVNLKTTRASRSFNVEQIVHELIEGSGQTTEQELRAQ